jgi:hypothetical protein
MWKETDQINVLCLHSPGGTEENFSQDIRCPGRDPDSGKTQVRRLTA